MAISFVNQEIKFNLPDKTKIRNWIKKIVAPEKKKIGQITFVFTSDEEMIKTNISYLNHNTFTDIITFDYNEGNTINGDILISVERVRENAEKFKTGFNDEIRRVMIHGVLHLCGYSDKKKKDVALMRKKEDQALRRF